MLQRASSQPCLALVVVSLAVAAGGSVHSRRAGVDVVIDEWTVPVGSRPHDPAVAPDGSIWYTGRRTNTLGRLNPITTIITEYALPTSSTSSRPARARAVLR